MQCFGVSKSTKLKYTIEQLTQRINSQEAELLSLRQQVATYKEKDEQQTEALQAASAHVAQLEARIQADKHERNEQLRLAELKRQQLEAQLKEKYQEMLAAQQREADVQRQQLEAQLREEQRRAAEQERTAYDKQQRLETQRQELEAQLTDERQRRMEQQQVVEQQKLLNLQVRRQLSAEEQKSRRLQKQLSCFTETMDEVSKVLSAVEQGQESKSTSSPVVVDRKVRPSVADQLRQSLALYKRAYNEGDEVYNDQGNIAFADDQQMG